MISVWVGTVSENAHRKVWHKKQGGTLLHPALCLKCSSWPAPSIRPGKLTRLLQDSCRGNLICLSNPGRQRSRRYLWVLASIVLLTLLGLIAMKKSHQYLHNPTGVHECFRRTIGDLQIRTSKIRNLDTGRVGITLEVLARQNVSWTFSGGAQKHGLGTTGYEGAVGRTCFSLLDFGFGRGFSARFEGLTEEHF